MSKTLPPGFEATAFVVDDDEDFRTLVRLWLEGDGYTVVEFGRATACLEAISSGVRASMVLLDLSMPGLDGQTALERIVSLRDAPPVIVLTAKRDVGTLLSMMRRGAYDFISKPVDRDRLLTTARNAVERHRMSRRLTELRHDRPIPIPGVVGASPVMRSLAVQVERVATSDVNVVIHGESGTGKELVARAVHSLSERHHAPFIALNCAAIPESLQDTELFGHERGSFHWCRLSTHWAL